MSTKRAEAFVREMLKYYGWYWHKYGDVRYCIYCHNVLPKSENAPDFSAGMVYTYIEAKNNSADGTWRWVEIAENGDRKNQREWLIKNSGWLFIELGLGTAPKGKSAFLIHFPAWVKDIEPELIRLEMKSIRKETLRNRPGADTFLAGWHLTWLEGKWVIPSTHYWWAWLDARLCIELVKVRSIVNGEQPS